MPGVGLFLGYYLLLELARDAIAEGAIAPFAGLWGVHGLALGGRRLDAEAQRPAMLNMIVATRTLHRAMVAARRRRRAGLPAHVGDALHRGGRAARRDARLRPATPCCTFSTVRRAAPRAGAQRRLHRRSGRPRRAGEPRGNHGAAQRRRLRIAAVRQRRAADAGAAGPATKPWASSSRRPARGWRHAEARRPARWRRHAHPLRAMAPEGPPLHASAGLRARGRARGHPPVRLRERRNALEPARPRERSARRRRRVGALLLCDVAETRFDGSARPRRTSRRCPGAARRMHRC